MDDHPRASSPARRLAGLVLLGAVGAAAIAGNLVAAGDLIAAIWSGIAMTMIDGLLRAAPTRPPGGGPGPDTPQADPEPPGSPPR